nr:MAG TPA: hypothetical protein [Caudoviricetes sp.]
MLFNNRHVSRHSCGYIRNCCKYRNQFSVVTTRIKVVFSHRCHLQSELVVRSVFCALHLPLEMSGGFERNIFEKFKNIFTFQNGEIFLNYQSISL